MRNKSLHIIEQYLSVTTALSALVFVVLLTSCSSTPQLLRPPAITFDEKLRAAHDDYIGTLEGCIVNQKDKPIKKLAVAANLEEFLNISSKNSRTDEEGCYEIELYWKNQPYLLADVSPNPAENSFTTGGLNYLMSARTVTVDIPIVTGKKAESLTEQEITMYSVSYVLKQIADEVVNPRLRILNYSVEDYTTGFPVAGAEVSITASSTILPVDSILAVYVRQQNLRELAASSIAPFITKSEKKIQEPKGSMEFIVMSYADYWLRVTHPEYHAVAEKLYIENDLDKIIRVTRKNQDKRIDIIDR